MTESTAIVALVAAYPSLRRQVLESVREDVAVRLSCLSREAFLVTDPAWRCYWLSEASRALGIGEEQVDSEQ